jgi:peptidoglycan/LPS O-acetylase OafA/YrhL
MSDPLLSRTDNNFNLLRLLAALGVIITHSYALLGLPEKDLLTQATNGLLSFSRLGVYVFFVISGFLVTNSLWVGGSVTSFFWKRFLRIFPALFVVLFITVFLVGPLFTTASLSEYFLQPDNYRYLLGGSILYDMQYTLLGVFIENPIRGVNGSLWTLPYEWTLYVILACLAVPLKQNRAVKLAALILFFLGLRLLVGRYLVFQVIEPLNLDTRQLLLWGVLFFAGALALELRKYLTSRFLLPLLLVLLLVWISFANKKLALYVMLFVVPYVIISLASLPLPKRIMEFFSNFDYSYGIYIYAFPVGQIVVYFFGKSLEVWSLALVTAATTLPLAMASWYLIEKPFLKLKKWSFKKESISPAL